MATLQTGTAPNQIPTNGDLGDLAFQSKESVQFTGGRGALSSINLNQIYKEIAVTAVDVFVYDTSKDSDGGAWRSRTQHTSWYNETLNTATRGSRREFPSVAVIVATTTSVTIYDGDDPVMPMWMVFNQGGSWPNNNIIGQTGSGSLTSVVALNGIVSVSLSADTFRAINFISELTKFWWGAYYREYKGFIVSRNSSSGWTDTASPYASIPSPAANDVAMTVLTNAPIDAATGLPIPTIAVATNGGVSIIKHDGSVVNLTFSTYAFGKVGFTSDNRLYFASDGGAPGTFSYSIFKSGIPSSSISADPSNTTYYDYYESRVTQTTVNVLGSGGSHDVDCVVAPIASAGTSGLTILKEVAGNKTTGMVSYITSKYNTGWMPGNIKGAWLSDNTADTMVGSELVTNGTFSSDTSWTKEAGWSISGGVATATTANYSDIMQDISTVVGKTYTMSVQVTSWSSGQFRFFATGTGYVYPTVSGTGYVTVSFIATSTTTSVRVGSGSVSGNFSIDNFSVRLADPDRSVNAKGLQIFGSITKTPVATGADLVGYSGWSTSNYLKQPPNPALNFGSASYSVMLWAKASSAGAGIAVGRGPNDNAENICIYLDTATYGVYFDYGSSAAYVYAPDIKSQVGDGKWHFVVCHVTAGQSGVVWWDGVKQTMQNASVGVAPATFINDPSWETYIGCGRQPDQPLPYHGSLALVRISATIPSPEQIAKMYNDEKYLFQDNAKATLYGSSDSVTALAYDEDTQLLHAGTSSGRSVFRGLRRVDNTTTAVGAAISAANGLVAED